MSVFTRSFPLEDISIRSEGDGRTVEAYAAVFGVPTEVRDQDGHYMEQIHRNAFDRTIAQRGKKFGVFYNHGMSLYGTPSDRFSVPIGTPEEVRVEARGVYTRTRYHNTELADEILESIRSGSITGQSFSGRFLVSDPVPPKFGFRAGVDKELPLVTRMEIAMREYGPTPMPNYEDAAIIGVRSVDLRRALREMDDDERAEMAALLNIPPARAHALAGGGMGGDALASADEPPAAEQHVRSHSDSVAKAADDILSRRLACPSI